MIPKIAHQIWMQGWENIPDKYLPNVNSITTNNPGWTFMRWDENGIKQLLEKKSCEGISGYNYTDKYNSFKTLHQKIDFARYLILYNYGGVSVDVDSMAKKGFDTLPELQTKDFIVSKNSTNSFINNATILVSKENPLLKEFLVNINGDCLNYGTDASCIYNTTGPGAFTNFVNEHKDQITILDNSFFEPCSGYDSECEVKENTIIDHEHEGTWIPPIAKGGLTFWYFLKNNWKLWLILIIIIILIILLIKK